MWTCIRSFCTRYVDKNDRLLLSLYAAMLFVGFIGLAVNAILTQYPGNNYLPTIWYFLAPFVILMLGVAWYAREMSPRLAMFTRFYTLYFIFSFCMAVLLNGIQFAPFSRIDPVLMRWDQWLGIDTPAIIAWTAHHRKVQLILEIAYTAVSVELMLLPALLALFKWEKRLNEYLLMLSVVAIIGSLVYYFFPTAAPVSVYDSPYFLHLERDTVLKFEQIRHYIQPTTKEGGMIAFPSFHVVWAVICAYVLRNQWWVFVPVALINAVAIVATVMLGWHYFVDVIAGIFLALIGMLFAKERPPNN